MDKNTLLKLKIGIILIDLNKIFQVKLSEFDISLSVKNYDKKLQKIAEMATLTKSAYKY